MSWLLSSRIYDNSPESNSPNLTPAPLISGNEITHAAEHEHACQAGDLIIGRVSRDKSRWFPFRARFIAPSCGGYSFICDGLYNSGHFTREGSVLKLYTMVEYDDTDQVVGYFTMQDKAPVATCECGESFSEDDEQYCGRCWRRRPEVAAIEGSIRSVVPHRDAYRPRPMNQSETLLFAGVHEARGLDLHPGGPVAKCLLFEHVFCWATVTAAGLASISYSSRDVGVELIVYIGYIPLLLLHLLFEWYVHGQYIECGERGSLLREPCRWFNPRIFTTLIFSALDHQDLLTDTIFVVISLKFSDVITEDWADLCAQTPVIGPGLAWVARFLGFGPYILLIYIFLVVFPQCLYGLCDTVAMQTDTLESDPAGERIEECILAMQDSASNASCAVIEEGLNRYVASIEMQNDLLHKQASDLLRAHDETLVLRLFKRVFLENLFQMWNQTTFLSLTMQADGSAANQVLFSVSVGLLMAMRKAWALGISASDVLLFPVTFMRWILVERANMQFIDPTSQVVRYWKTGLLEVVPMTDPPLNKAKSNQLRQTFNQDGFREELVGRRQAACGVVIMFFCAVLVLRTAGIFVCDGPFNLTSGCLRRIPPARERIVSIGVLLLSLMALMSLCGAIMYATCGNGDPTRFLTSWPCCPKRWRGQNLFVLWRQTIGLQSTAVQLDSIVLGNLPYAGSGDFSLSVSVGGRHPATTPAVEKGNPRMVQLPDSMVLHLRPDEKVVIVAKALEAGLQSRELSKVEFSADDLLDRLDDSRTGTLSERFVMEDLVEEGALGLFSGQTHLAPWIFFSLLHVGEVSTSEDFINVNLHEDGHRHGHDSRLDTDAFKTRFQLKTSTLEPHVQEATADEHTNEEFSRRFGEFKTPVAYCSAVAFVLLFVCALWVLSLLSRWAALGVLGLLLVAGLASMLQHSWRKHQRKVRRALDQRSQKSQETARAIRHSEKHEEATPTMGRWLSQKSSTATPKASRPADAEPLLAKTDP